MGESMTGSDAISCDTIESIPLAVRWGDPDEPVPVRAVRDVGKRPPAGIHDAIPPWVTTGPEGKPFDFCSHVRRLADDIVRRCPAYQHIRTGQILFAFTQARNHRRTGLQARVTPLRFAGGKAIRRHRGSRYFVQRWYVGGREMLYLMTFCLPRFLDQSFDDKVVTLFHELYHIGPRFDGDLRRHAGRCTIHTDSRRKYDERMAELARTYLSSRPDPDLHAFLRLSFGQLCERHGSVVGVRVPRPKIVVVPEE